MQVTRATKYAGILSEPSGTVTDRTRDLINGDFDYVSCKPAMWHASPSNPDFSLCANFSNFSGQTWRCYDAMLRGIFPLSLFNKPTSSMGHSQNLGRLLEPRVAQMTNLDIMGLAM